MNKIQLLSGEIMRKVVPVLISFIPIDSHFIDTKVSVIIEKIKLFNHINIYIMGFI